MASIPSFRPQPTNLGTTRVSCIGKEWGPAAAPRGLGEEGLGRVFAFPSHACTLQEAVTFFLSPLPPKKRWVAAVRGPSVLQRSQSTIHVLVLSTHWGFCHSVHFLSGGQPRRAGV